MSADQLNRTAMCVCVCCRIDDDNRLGRHAECSQPRCATYPHSNQTVRLVAQSPNVIIVVPRVVGFGPEVVDFGPNVAEFDRHNFGRTRTILSLVELGPRVEFDLN